MSSGCDAAAAEDLSFDTHQVRSPPMHAYGEASTSVNPRYYLLSRPLPCEGKAHLSNVAAAAAATAHVGLSRSDASSRASGHRPPHSLSIRSSPTVFGEGRHVESYSSQPSTCPCSAHATSQGPQGAREQRRTFSLHGNECIRTAATSDRGDCRRAVCDADRHSALSAGVIQPSASTWASPTISAIVSPAALASSFPSPGNRCWICEDLCVGGPGSTWDEAPALFFGKDLGGLPASLLTLCQTCAVAVAKDFKATPQQILSLCQNTSATCYRTAAYVNAVREYKLLLELIADKVVRSCERYESSEARRQHTHSRAGGSPSRGIDQMPLTFLLPSLQRKVLGQLLEALEDLLQRDQRAVHLAASRTPFSWKESPLLFSEVMAPMERHVLFEEVAHVERQLMSIRPPATAAVGMLGEPKVPPTSVLRRHLQRAPSSSQLHTDENRCVDDGGLADFPRSSMQQHRLSPRFLAVPNGGVEKETAGPSSRMADAHRPSLMHYPRVSSHSQTEPASGCVDTPPPSSLFPSRRGGSSPPELTSPQRCIRSRYDGRITQCTPRESYDDLVLGNRTPTNRGVAQLSTLPPPVTAAARPSPLFAEPRHGSRIADDRRTTGGTGIPAPDAVSIEDTRLPVQVAKSSRRDAPSTVQSRSPIEHQDCSSLRSSIQTAMWGAYRGALPIEGGSRVSARQSAEEFGLDRCTEGFLERSSTPRVGTNVKNDSELQLWDYFTAQFSTSRPLRIGRGGGDGGHQALPFALRPTASHHFEGECSRPLSPLQPNEARPQEQDKAVELDAFGGPQEQYICTDTAALQRRVLHERQLREEAVDAMLSAHARIAALERNTKDMSEALRTHHLSVTFRTHLDGMELLVGRCTRLAQNVCLQKSLLFAEEAAIVVRQLVRKTFGVTSLWPVSAHQGKQREPPLAVDCVGSSASRGRQEGEELWVGSEDEDNAKDTP